MAGKARPSADSCQGKLVSVSNPSKSIPKEPRHASAEWATPPLRQKAVCKKWGNKHWDKVKRESKTQVTKNH